MKNVTITLEEDVARWARVYAAEHDTSVSKLLGEILKERMQHEQSYEKARSRFMGRAPVKLRDSHRELPGRDELHDRNGLR